MVRASILFLAALLAGCTCSGKGTPSTPAAGAPPPPVGGDVEPVKVGAAPASKGGEAPAGSAMPADTGLPKPDTKGASPAALPVAATVGAVERVAKPSPDGSAYQPVEIPRDVAAVEGRVTWTREVPAAVDYEVPAAAQETCGTTQRHRPVEVDSAGGVVGAVVRLPGVSQGRAFFKAPGMIPTFTLSGCKLHPRTLSLPAGGALRVVNSDAVEHTLVARRADKALFTLTVKAGETVERSVPGEGFTEVRGGPGREWLRGWVHTGPHPYATVTAAGGAYRLSSVLKGGHSVEVWHPGVEQGAPPVVARRGLTVDRWLAAHADFDLAP